MALLCSANSCFQSLLYSRLVEPSTSIVGLQPSCQQLACGSSGRKACARSRPFGDRENAKGRKREIRTFDKECRKTETSQRSFPAFLASLLTNSLFHSCFCPFALSRSPNGRLLAQAFSSIWHIACSAGWLAK